MVNNDWPVAFREVHLIGGAYAINDPNEKDKVYIFPNSLDGQQAVLTIPSYSKLFYAIKKLRISKIVGVEFLNHVNQIDGISPTEWRAYSSYKSNSWAHIEACWKWGDISFEAYKCKNGHLWDLSKRIQHQITTLNNSLQHLSSTYRRQLNSKVADGFEDNERFENGYSSYIYDSFQHFLFDACMLRDYIAEFVFHYVVPLDVKSGEKHMTTTSKIYNKYYKSREVSSDYEVYFKNICSSNGWLNELGVYRDLVMHACPLSMPKQRVWIRTGTIELLGNKLLPQIIAPIPKKPLDLKNERNSFKYFSDFERQANAFFNQANDEEESIDILSYAIDVMDNFSTLLWLTIEQSPLKGIQQTFGPHNIIGNVRTIVS
ncbi:hypothetical protein M2G63_20510 [Vibrio vulnificus]|nr:hypothetical protein [Vibrio vulnificus]MCU8540438.1 hypothetical protein [Vibrio vulnificus]MCU8545043.1 hypothetical protein [Vibrio vulnificus]